MEITNDIVYVGVNDHEIDLFEAQYPVPHGMSYNSYVIIDEKIAVMDTVDAHFKHQWLDQISALLGDRHPDYLIVQHMEPDHSANIVNFLQLYKDAVVVSSKKSFAMMQQFFGMDFAERRIVVEDGDTLCLGKHTLTFMAAPMVHWPEVMVTYDSCDKVLFSADAFGKFGALDVEEDWADEARRYYFGIVGKYGVQTRNILKKAARLDIQIICSLHGPVLKENLGYYMRLYNIWASYKAESEGIVIAYTSIYGNTEKAMKQLADKLRAKGCPNVIVHDLARVHVSKAVEDAFRYNKLILAAVTYNSGIFPAMRNFIEHLTERGYQNRMIAFVENGSWSPAATKVMKKMLEESKNLTFADTEVRIMSALNGESSLQLEALSEELCRDYRIQRNKIRSYIQSEDSDLLAELCEAEAGYVRKEKACLQGSYRH